MAITSGVNERGRSLLEILFSTSKLRKDCHDFERLRRRYGTRQAELIRKRLDEMADSDNLAVLGTIPQARCHELKMNRAGQLSVDLEHPYRLIFTPAHDPVPRRADGGLDWSRVTSVTILGVENTHE